MAEVLLGQQLINDWLTSKQRFPRVTPRKQSLKRKISQVQWYTLIVPATQEVEVGGLYEPRSSHLAWAA
jgi:hypothetical protein